MTGIDGLSVMHKATTNTHVLLEADGRQPWLVIDRKTGAPTGRLTFMVGTDSFGNRLFTGHVFDPRDGRTVWLVDGGTVYQVDLSARQPVCTFRPDEGKAFSGGVVAGNGCVLIGEAAPAGDFVARARDVMVFDASGKERARQAMVTNDMTALRDGFVVFDAKDKRFRVLDCDLNELETVPHDTDFVRFVALPSGREWIAIGGHGEWDRFGEADLQPRAVVTPPEPAQKKPAPAKKKR